MFAKSFFVALAGLAALAQGLDINTPKSTDTLKPGQRFLVELDYRPGQTVTKDVSVVIAMQHCPSSARFSGGVTCDGLASPLGPDGDILYAGPFAPEMQAGSGTTDRIQDFYVTVPAGLQPGVAIVNVVHFGLVSSAAGFSPFTESVNVTLTVSN